jgi:hypothetical protein
MEEIPTSEGTAPVKKLAASKSVHRAASAEQESAPEETTHSQKAVCIGAKGHLAATCTTDSARRLHRIKRRLLLQAK